MQSSDPDPRQAVVHELREAAARRAETTSLRQTAREIGMSPTGLKKFIAGVAPYSPTLRRLRKWYITTYAREETEIDQALAAYLEKLDSYPEREFILVADLDVVPPEMVTELMASLDALHRAWGGGGLRIASTHTGTAAVAEVGV